MEIITQGKTNWKFLLIVVILAAVVAGGILAWQYFGALEEEVKPKEEVKITEVETANWKTYRSEEYGYEVKYPQDWEMETKTTRWILWHSPRQTPEKRVIVASVLDNPEGFSIPTVLLGHPATCEYIEVSNLLFCKLTEKFEAVYTISYSFSKAEKIYSLRLLISGGRQRMDYYLPDEEIASELKIFNQMLSTFRFLE